MQAGPPALESRRAVSGGATATRAASAGGDALTDKEYACAWRGRSCRKEFAPDDISNVCECESIPEISYVWNTPVLVPPPDLFFSVSRL